MHVPNHQAEEKYGERALPYKGRLASCRPPLPGVFHLIDTAFASSDSHRSLLKKTDSQLSSSPSPNILASSVRRPLWCRRSQHRHAVSNGITEVVYQGFLERLRIGYGKCMG